METHPESGPGPVAVPLGSDVSDGSREDRFRLTGEARGPWSGDAAHGGVPAALLARQAKTHCEPGGMRLAAISMTFNGPLPVGEIAIRSKVVKPGRRQRIVALELTGGGMVWMEARAVLLRRGTVDLPPVGPSGDGLSEPGRGREVDQRRWAWDEGPAFHRTANTVLAVEGGPDRVGERGSAWFRLDSELVAGEPVGGAERAVAAADFGNGVAHPVPFGEYVFANCDLNVSLLRDPVGEWIRVQSHSRFDPGGTGVTTSGLYDQDGYLGTATQTLYVDRASA